MIRKLRNMLRNSRGQFAMAVGNVVALLITISIGAMVLYTITGALPAEANSYTDNTIHAVEERGGTAFNLLSILAVVIVAATIIGTIVRAVGGGAPASTPESERSYLLKILFRDLIGIKEASQRAPIQI